MRVNQATVDLVKEFEGYRSEAYLAPEGNWTIGYGTTAAAGVGIVPRPGMTITQKEAETYLHLALEKFAKQIASGIKQPVNENEFGAFVSLAYNIGPGAFLKSSALSLFNDGKKDKAAQAFLLWNKATVKGVRKVLPGLDRRRRAEAALFARKPAKITPQAGHGVLLTGLAAVLATAVAAFFEDIRAALAALF